MRDIYSDFVPSFDVPPPPSNPVTFEEAVDLVATWEVQQDMFGGMAMRNALDLWNKEGLLHKHMLFRFGLCHADDTGMLISNAAEAKKKGLSYDPTEDIHRVRDHWKRYGVNPATMEKVLPLCTVT